MDSRLAFIGIGNMGWPMARRLVDRGFIVNVYDQRLGRADEFAQQVGGFAAATVEDAVRGCDTVVTMLPSSAEVSTVIETVIDVISPGALIIEMSSGDPETTRGIARLVGEVGGVLVDCPVSGGVARAETGTLSIMAGGEEAAIRSAMPILGVVASSVHRCGPIGAGQAMKALNNLASAGAFLITAEALLLGRQIGLDPDVMIEILNASSGMNNSTRNKFKQFVLSDSFDSGFGLDLMVKDLGIALGIGHHTDTAVPFSALCLELWRCAAAVLGPGQDHTAVVKMSEQMSGVRLGRPTE